MHMLGFGHEQGRPDQKQHITVIEDNLTKDGKIAWTPRTYHEAYAFGSYDVCSIMHYKDYGGVKQSPEGEAHFAI